MDKDLYKPLLIGILSLTLFGGCGGVAKDSSKDLKITSSEPLQTDSKLQEEENADISTSVVSNTITTPAAPTGIAATALSPSIIAIIWQNRTGNETGFKVERRTGRTEQFSRIASGSGSKGFYENSGLSPDTTYCYRVQVYNSAGDSPYSSESCAATKHKLVVAPTAITGEPTNISFNTATLNGTVNPNGLTTGVFFQWGPATSSFKNMTPLKSVSGTSDIDVSADLTGILVDTTYYYRTVAVTKNKRTVGSQKSFTTSKLPEHIINGSFSSGTMGWILTGDFWVGTNLNRYRTSPGYATGGVNSAGALAYNLRGSMYQTIVIPSNSTSATLSFWLNVTSEESAATRRDILYVELLDLNGELLKELARYSNLDKTVRIIYSRKSFDLTSYKGEAISIRFRIVTDDALPTVFRIDDVSLMSDG